MCIDFILIGGILGQMSSFHRNIHSNSRVPSPFDSHPKKYNSSDISIISSAYRRNCHSCLVNEGCDSPANSNPVIQGTYLGNYKMKWRLNGGHLSSIWAKRIITKMYEARDETYSKLRKVIAHIKFLINLSIYLCRT